jgi:hypothetical protein
MPSLIGAVTTLGLLGLGTAAPVFNADQTQKFPRPYTETFTALGLSGTPAKRAVDFSGKTELTSVSHDVSDTAYISVTEEPIEEQDIAAYDTARLSVTDTAALFNFLAVTDTARISISETVALVSGTVVTKTASDTASLSVTDTSALSVSVSASDTASISVGDVASLVTALEQKSATDTASLTTEEDTLLGIFTGLLEITGSDIASLTLSESASVLEVKRIRRIALAISAPRITLEIN